MIQKLYVHKMSCLFDLRSHHNILSARRRIAPGMIVHQNNLNRAVFHRKLKYLPCGNKGLIYKAGAYDPVADRTILSVKTNELCFFDFQMF